jgi:hypothetical protein
MPTSQRLLHLSLFRRQGAFDLAPRGLSDLSGFRSRFSLGQGCIRSQIFELLITRFKDWPDLGYLVVCYVQRLPHPLQFVLHLSMGHASLLFGGRRWRRFLSGEAGLANRQQEGDGNDPD